MSLKQEISMILDYGHTSSGAFISTEIFIGVGNLVYHKFLSDSSERMTKFLSDCIGEKDISDEFLQEVFPKIKTETVILGSIDLVDQYHKEGSTDYVGVLIGKDKLSLELQLYKKIRRMIKESLLSFFEINIGYYQIGNGKLIVFLHKGDPIFMVMGRYFEKQNGLFD